MMRKKSVIEIVDATFIDVDTIEDAASILVAFYRGLGWNGEDLLDPCKVRTTKAVYDSLVEAMLVKCPDQLTVGAAMVNKGPGVDDDIPSNKVYLLKGWIQTDKSQRTEENAET